MKITLAMAVAIATATAGSSAGAKTANWSVAPQYDAMELAAPGAYKVKRGVYTGVIDARGKEIVAMTSDSITPFVGGHALVLTPAGDGYFRLQAILNDDLSRTDVVEEVWVEDYPFFSEGMLPVRNKQGFYGYMNASGVMVLKPAYLNVHPFSEGYAAVIKRPTGVVAQLLSKGMDKVMEWMKKKATVTYVNRAGTELKVQKDVGKIYNASTFNNGVSLVEDKEGNRYLINKNGAVVRRLGAQEAEFDDRYVYIDDDYDNHSDFDAAFAKKAEADQTVKIFKEGDKYGYRTGVEVVLPAQFNEADLFYDDYAMASRNGKWGILHLDNGTFAMTAPAKAAPARKGKKAAAAAPAKGYTVTTPALYEKETLTLALDANGNVTKETVGGDGTDKRLFPLAKPASSYVATLSSKDLVLWKAADAGSGSVAAATANGSADSQVLRIAISPATSKADVKDNATITVTLTNPTDQEVSTTVKVSGKGLTPVSRPIKIPANSSRRVSTAFTKVYEREARPVTVTAAGRSASKNITVTPFYVKF